MTPKEKAEDLMDTIFKRTYHIKGEDAKQCALITVDELIKELNKIGKESIQYDFFPYTNLEYWQEVKNEIYNNER